MAVRLLYIIFCVTSLANTGRFPWIISYSKRVPVPNAAPSAVFITILPVYPSVIITLQSPDVNLFG